MTPQVLTILGIGRQNGEDAQPPYPINGWGVKMAVGSQVAAVATHADSLALIVLTTPTAIAVWHPVLIFQVGQSFTPLLGRKIGKCFGGVGQWLVFEDAPWPQTALEGLQPAGAA